MLDLVDIFKMCRSSTVVISRASSRRSAAGRLKWRWNSLADDSSEDAGLWQAVLAHQAYREAHPEEAPEVFKSPEAFLKAAANL